MNEKLEMKFIEEYVNKRIAEESKNIMKETYAGVSNEKISFESIEKGLRNRMLELGGKILEECIKLAGTGYKKSSLKCNCGERKKFISNRKKKGINAC